MKKLITILAIMIVLIGAVFADTAEHLTVTAVVEARIPQYTMKGTVGTDTEFAKAVDGKTATPYNVITTGENIAGTNGVTVLIRVYTQGTTQYIGTRNLSVTAYELKLNTDNTKMTALPSCTANIKGDDIERTLSGGGDKNFESTATSENNVASYSVKYNGVLVPEGTIVGTATFNWAQNETLPVGDYSADILLTYTTT